jgi:hypothetical protein
MDDSRDAWLATLDKEKCDHLHFLVINARISVTSASAELRRALDAAKKEAEDINKSVVDPKQKIPHEFFTHILNAQVMLRAEAVQLWNGSSPISPLFKKPLVDIIVQYQKYHTQLLEADKKYHAYCDNPHEIALEKLKKEEHLRRMALAAQLQRDHDSTYCDKINAPLATSVIAHISALDASVTQVLLKVGIPWITDYADRINEYTAYALVIAPRDMMMQLDNAVVNAEIFLNIIDTLPYDPAYAEIYVGYRGTSYEWTIAVINPAEYSDVISSAPHACGSLVLNDLKYVGYAAFIQLVYRDDSEIGREDIDTYDDFHKLMPELDIALEHTVCRCICSSQMQMQQ